MQRGGKLVNYNIVGALLIVSEKLELDAKVETVTLYDVRSRLDRSVELLYKCLNSVPVG